MIYMDEDPNYPEKQTAERHARFYADRTRTVTYETFVDAFTHGYKHGLEDAMKNTPSEPYTTPEQLESFKLSPELKEFYRRAYKEFKEHEKATLEARVAALEQHFSEWQEEMDKWRDAVDAAHEAGGPEPAAVSEKPGIIGPVDARNPPKPGQAQQQRDRRPARPACATCPIGKTLCGALEYATSCYKHPMWMDYAYALERLLDSRPAPAPEAAQPGKAPDGTCTYYPGISCDICIARPCLAESEAAQPLREAFIAWHKARCAECQTDCCFLPPGEWEDLRPCVHWQPRGGG